MITFTLLMLTIMIKPYYLGDPQNFIPANPLKTPLHIKPEWYFLFTYFILQSIPNKLGGVIAMFMSIMILMTLSLMKKINLSSQFCPLTKMIMWYFLMIMMMLTWLSTVPMENSFIQVNQVMTMFYFLVYIFIYLANQTWMNIMMK